MALTACAAETGRAPPEPGGAPVADAAAPRAGRNGSDTITPGPAGGASGSAADAATPAGPPPTDPTPAVPPPVALPDTVSVVISELMYHPVTEGGDEEQYEFVELHNRGKGEVSLSAWKLQGDVTFAFPPTARLRPGQYLVVARNRQALASVKKYELAAIDVHGDYTGALDNGGGRIAVVDAAGNTVDAVKFDDAAPWPVGADALGAGEAWLPRAWLPLSAHEHLGRSLERISVDAASDSAANWEASALDGATPGRPNSVAGTPLPIVDQIGATPDGKNGAVGPTDRIAVRARFSAGTVADVRLEYFADDLARADEPRMTAAMTAVGGAFQAIVPAQPANTILRYRVVATRGAASGVVSPRATDPFEWHVAAVTAPVPTKARVYHLFVAPAEWTRLWTNVAGGRMNGCEENPAWDATVPAVFAHDGRAYDVRVRYQGSFYNRVNGNPITGWTAPGPSAPAPLRALSWNVRFPRHAPFEGKGKIILNKMLQACPGINAYVESKLLERAGLPSYGVRFARLHVNGGYYNFVMEPEAVDDDMMRRYLKPGEKVGDLIKSDGINENAGPLGRGDLARMAPFCNHAPARRIAAVYPRSNHEWRGTAEITKLIDELGTARAGGTAAMRAHLEKNFDTAALATSFAIRNWAGVWDDTLHNFFLYKRPTDGKWLLIQQDFDLDFGLGKLLAQPPHTHQSSNGSLFTGLEGDPTNRLGVSHLKDAFLKSFRAEFTQRLRDLSKTLLARDAVLALVDEGVAAFSLDDWNASPAKKSCDVKAATEAIRQWVREREAVLAAVK